MSTISITSMAAGLRTDVAPARLADDATPACDNVIFDTGTVAVRPGRTLHGVVNATAPLRALCEYHNPADAGDTRFVAVDDAQVYVSAGPAQSFTPALTMATTVASTRRPRLAQFKENIYLCDGEHPVKKFLGFDNLCWTTARWGSPGSGDNQFEVSGAGGPSSIAIAPDGKIYICDTANYRVVRYSSAGVFEGWYGKDNAATPGYGWHAAGSGKIAVSGTENGAFVSPAGVCVTGTNLYVTDKASSNSSVQQFTLGGTFVKKAIRIADDPPGVNTPLYHPHSVAVDGGGNVWVADENAVTRYASTLDYTTCISYYHPEKQGSFAVTALALDALGHVYVACGESEGYAMGIPSRICVYQGGAGDDAFGLMSEWILGDWQMRPSGLAIAGDYLYAAMANRLYRYTLTGSLDAIWGQEIDRCVAARVTDTGVVVYTTGQVQYDLLVHTQAEADPSVVQELREPPTPATAPVVSVLANDDGPYNFPPDTYDVCWTYARLCPTRNAEYEESAPSPVGTLITTADANLSIALQVNRDNGLCTGDRVFIYLRNASTVEWRRVAQCPFDPLAASDRITIDQRMPVQDDAALLDPFVSQPPAGCALLLEWQGRMAYAKDDVLYLSRWDDPMHIAPLGIVDDPSQYGLWVRIGTDGGEITGLGKIGSYLVVLKRRGVWLVSGDPGTETFSVAQISESTGCCAHETIQQVGGNLLVWLDDHHVWGFDGQQFVDIGKPLNGVLPTYAADVKRDAFAVYDPLRQWYQLTLGTESFVLYRDAAGQCGWTHWSHQPDGCALYAHHLATPGVFAGDGHGTLYRLHDGGLDVAAPIAWSWYSKVYETPQTLGYLQLRRCLAQLRAAESGTQTLQLHLRINGAEVDAAACARDLRGDNRWDLPIWAPPVQADATGVQLGVSGETHGGVELAALVLDLAERGGVR